MESAVATAIATLIGAAVGGFVTYLAAKRKIESEERREALTRAEQADVLIRRYRDPLVRAAFDLQSRIYNIVVIGFLQKYLVDGTSAEQEYAGESTLYLLSEYLGWVELLRREVQFLDLGDLEQTRRLTERIDEVTAILLSPDFDPAFRLFRGEQRAIGEIALTTNPAGARECIGFAEFVSRRQDPGFSRWYRKLEQDVALVAAEPGAHDGRLIALQHALLDLLDLLDPEHLRFAARHRQRIGATGG